MIWFNGPTSLCQKAASFECFSRAGSASPNRFSASAIEPGRNV